MTEHQRPPSCSTCGKPLPCVLHDRKTREAILAPEEGEPGFEMTKEWERDRLIIEAVARISPTDVLVKIDRDLFMLDLSRGVLGQRTLMKNTDGISQTPDGRIFIADAHGQLSEADFSTGFPDLRPIAKLPISPFDEPLQVFPLSKGRLFVHFTEDVEDTHGENDGNSYAVGHDDVLEPTPDGSFKVGRAFGDSDAQVFYAAGRVRLASEDQDVPFEQLIYWGLDWFKQPKKETSNWMDAVRAVSGSKMLTANRVPGAWKRRLFVYDFNHPFAVPEPIVELDTNGMRACALSDERFVFVGDDQLLQLLQVTDRGPMITPIAHSPKPITSLFRVSDTKFLLGTSSSLQLWEVPEAKVRAHHERQAATDDEELPELPDV